MEKTNRHSNHRILTPLPLMMAAFACSHKGDGRDHLAGVFIQARVRTLHVVGTDGHRLFIGSTLYDKSYKIPGWLKEGLLISNDGLGRRLAFLSAGAKFCTVRPRGGTIEISNIGGSSTFQLPTVEAEFCDYERMALTLGADGDEVSNGIVGGTFAAVGFNGKHLKDVAGIAKMLSPKDPSVNCYVSSEKGVILFTFPGCPGAMVYQMPVKVGPMAGQTTALMAPAIKASLGALRAHKTRNVAAAKAAATVEERIGFETKAEAFQARITAILANTGINRALPKPDAKPKVKKARKKVAKGKGKGATATVEAANALSPTVAKGSVRADQAKPDVAGQVDKSVGAVADQSNGNGKGRKKVTAAKGNGFDDWMGQVNRAIDSKVGLDSRDLEDVPYRDWYDAKLSPSTAANRAVAYTTA